MGHNPGVSFKPGDFFVSVLGFFAIISKEHSPILDR
jgi:hypothetical protein